MNDLEKYKKALDIACDMAANNKDCPYYNAKHYPCNEENAKITCNECIINYCLDKAEKEGKETDENWF